MTLRAAQLAVVLAVVAMQSALTQTSADDKGLESIVTIDVRDNYGHEVGGAIEMRSVTTVYTPTSRAPFKAKYGDYRVAVLVPGFNRFQGTVTIGQARQTISVALRLGTMDGPQFVTCSVHGRTSPSRRPPKVRLMSLFGSDVIDVPVGDGGEFAFTDVECGRYLLFAMDDSNCLASQLLTLNKEGQRVDLKIASGTEPCDGSAPPQKHH